MTEPDKIEPDKSEPDAMEPEHGTVDRADPAGPQPSLPEDEPDIAAEHAHVRVDAQTTAGRGTRESESPRGLAGMD